VFFFFSSRRRHTRLQGDWSSDVCSSDLNLNLGSITNTIHTPSGTSDPTGAVAIVLDSSDTGTLDISSAVLNGLDDLNPPGYTGQIGRASCRERVEYV